MYGPFVFQKMLSITVNITHEPPKLMLTVFVRVRRRWSKVIVRDLFDGNGLRSVFRLLADIGQVAGAKPSNSMVLVVVHT